MFVAVVQGGIGYLQYFNDIPATLVAAHVAGATALWVVTVQFIQAALEPIPSGPDERKVHHAETEAEQEVSAAVVPGRLSSDPMSPARALPLAEVIEEDCVEPHLGSVYSSDRSRRSAWRPSRGGWHKTIGCCAVHPEDRVQDRILDDGATVIEPVAGVRIIVENEHGDVVGRSRDGR